MIGKTHAQSKFGLDENACKENLSLFREYYKQKNYKDALKPWNNYSWSKLGGECAVQMYKNSLIIRLCMT